MIKTTRDIAFAFIEANKNNRGVDLIGHKEWVDKESLIKKFKEFENWLDIEIYNDRIDLSIREQELIINKLEELKGEKR